MLYKLEIKLIFPRNFIYNGITISSKHGIDAFHTPFSSWLEKKQGKRDNWTWIGRMAVWRAKRRWSKEPRMATMLSVIAWLLFRESFRKAALSLKSVACGITIVHARFSGTFSSLIVFHGKRKMQTLNLRIEDFFLRNLPVVDVDFPSLLPRPNQEVVTRYFQARKSGGQASQAVSVQVPSGSHVPFPTKNFFLTYY